MLSEEEPKPREGPARRLTQVMRYIGWGTYQSRLFFIAGMGYACDAIETALISWLTAELTNSGKWNVTENQLALLAFSVFFGEFVGAFLWGECCDYLGRKRTFVIAMTMLATFGLLSAFATSFPVFVVLRALVGIGVGSTWIPIDMMMENVPLAEAFQTSAALNYFWSFGTVYLNLAAPFILGTGSWGHSLYKAIGIEPWRQLTIMAALPIVVSALGCFIIEESPLWLHETGRDDEAMQALRRIATVNGKDLDGTLVPRAQRSTEVNLCQMFNERLRPRSMALCVMWFMSIFGYYGASLATPMLFGATEHGKTSYTALLFGASGEVLGVTFIIWLSGHMSYMRSCTYIFILSAVSVIFLLPLRPYTLALGLTDFVARGATCGGTCILFAATPFAYPTTIRGQANGALYAVARFGAMAATMPVSIVMQMYVCTAAMLITGLVAKTQWSQRMEEDEWQFELFPPSPRKSEENYAACAT